MQWFKGNTHCHSSKSDGRATPANVAKYYKSKGYDFTVISDHNYLTPVTDWAEKAGILGIPACELTGSEFCHVVGLNIKSSIKPTEYSYKDMAQKFQNNIYAEKLSEKELLKAIILQDAIDKIIADGGIPILCHPSWHWTFDAKIALALKNWKFFEVCNAGPDCNSYPTPMFSSGDEIWDTLLSEGKYVFGIASDDAHEYYLPYEPRGSFAGKGYIMVRSSKLSIENILTSILNGDFYSTTGIEIKEYSVDKKGIHIEINPLEQEKTCFQFFGENGKILQNSFGTKTFYEFTGKEKYVRARLSSTSGFWAWTLPIRLKY